MYNKILRSLSVIGTIGWAAVVLAAVFEIIRSVFFDTGSAMLGIIVLVLVAINFNISMLLGFKRKEYENTVSLIQKLDEPFADPMPRNTRQNPFLN
jgi:hypothetical protein